MITESSNYKIVECWGEQYFSVCENCLNNLISAQKKLKSSHEFQVVLNANTYLTFETESF
jgi:hypothetical protein